MILVPLSIGVSDPDSQLVLQELPIESGTRHDPETPGFGKDHAAQGIWRCRGLSAIDPR
jgi:hypothetical protein